MRLLITAAAAIALSGCSAGAQPVCQYDFYIYQPQGERDGQIYAVAGAGRATAIEVNSCDATWYADPTGLITELRDLRRADEIDIVTVPAEGSRTYLGSCRSNDDDHDPERRHDGEQNIVVITDATAAQTRRLIQQIDAASDEMREEAISTLGLRGCMGQTSARR